MVQDRDALSIDNEAAGSAHFTSGQRDILRSIFEGEPASEISARLNISALMIDKHLLSAREIFGERDGEEAARRFLEWKCALNSATQRDSGK